MVARHHDRWGFHPHPVEEDVGRLEFAVPSALAQVAGDSDRRGVEAGKELLQRLDLPEVGVAAEMKIGEMDDGDG
jgi:hypothetical protein